MLSQLAVDHGAVNKALFVAIVPCVNRRAMAALDLYASQLADPEPEDKLRVPFIALTLEACVEALAAAGATDLADKLHRRYLDFQRVLELALTPPVKPVLTARRTRSPANRAQTQATAPQPSSPRHRAQGSADQPPSAARSNRSSLKFGAAAFVQRTLMRSSPILITATQWKRLLADGRQTVPGQEIFVWPVVRLFQPDAADSWLLTHFDPADPSRDRIYALHRRGGDRAELGFISLAGLGALVRAAPLQRVERDCHFRADRSLAACASEARP